MRGCIRSGFRVTWRPRGLSKSAIGGVIIGVSPSYNLLTKSPGPPSRAQGLGLRLIGLGLGV